MLDFYTRYYRALPHSRVYSEYCRRVYGADFGQHGFSDMAQVHALIRAVALTAGERALDLGCGDGRMAEYVSDTTGAHITGLDYISQAVESALKRTHSKRERLEFVCGDLTCMEKLFCPASFDVVISIDTLYFGDLPDLIRQMKALLGTGGRLGIFYAHGADPRNPIETFPRDTLPADAGPVARALRAHGLSYRYWDFTEDDYRHARLKKAVIEELLPQCRTDDDRFLLESRLGEANGVRAACEAGCQSRYLFLAEVS